MATSKSHIPKTAVKKRTSIGLKHAPKNKHKRRMWKAYNRQGKP